MNPSPSILQILQKCWQNRTLDDNEETGLRAWLSESAENRILFDNLETRFLSSSGEINMKTTELPDLPIHPVIPENDDQDNGSANAFEATENPIAYEEDISDEQLDDRIETE